MMNEEDRKKVFWLLKKYSSYTAWKTLGDAYAKFAKEYEYAVVNTLNVSGELDEEEFNEFVEWNSDHLKTILDGQIAFEKGLPLLLEGQRSVFRNTSTGYLNRAADAIIFVNRIMDPDEFVFDWMVNKEDVIQAAQTLKSRISGLFLVCEADELPMVAYGVALMFRPSTAPYNFPAILPDVPSPTDELVETGNEVPVTGAWEPEWAVSPSADNPSPSQAASGFLNSVGQYASNLLKPLTTAAPAKLESGCMTYLLAGTNASKYKENYGEPEINVTWRHIWKDDRYLDGSIPEEEQEYLAEAAPEGPGPDHSRLRGLRNELVPKTGWWHSLARPSGQALHYFEAGQHFPDWQFTTTGEVIWDFDPDKQAPPPKK